MPTPFGDGSAEAEETLLERSSVSEVDVFKLLGDDDESDDEPIPELALSGVEYDVSQLDPSQLAALEPALAQAYMREMAAPMQRGTNLLEDDDDDYVFPDPIPVHQQLPMEDEPAYIDPHDTTGEVLHLEHVAVRRLAALLQQSGSC
eukprot:SAG31_NODE_6534_length_1986_cov_1.231585_1_plen_147_part_00